MSLAFRLSAGGGRAGATAGRSGFLLRARWRLKQEPDPRGRCGNDAGMIWRHQRWDRIARTLYAVPD
jgi:hypothetical protein